MFDNYEKFLDSKLNPKIIALIFIFAIVYTLASCSGATSGSKPAQTEDVVSQAVATADTVVDEAEDATGSGSFFLGDFNMLECISGIDDIFAVSGASADSIPEASVRSDTDTGAASGSSFSTATGDYEPTEWDESSCPGYYRVDGNAIIAYDVRSENGGIVYNGLDSLGRTTWAAGYITDEMRAEAKERGRQDFSAECDKITGWGHNGKVSIPSANGGKDYNGYMFNRSHLIADSLGGDPIRVNLITGTRCQNVGNSDNKGGMAYAEELAREYLDSHDGYIYYAATPVYVGDEMVPRSVFVDIRSDDYSIDEHIEVYNVANGYTIDYMTGEYTSN